MATYPRCLTSYTEQEALNQHLGRVIRLTPTIVTGSSTSGDVLCQNIEIPNAVAVPGGTSKLINIYIINYGDVANDFEIIFHENADAVMSDALGNGLGNSSTWTDANIRAIKILGYNFFDATDFNLDWVTSRATGGIRGAGDATAVMSRSPLLFQAASGSTSIYFGIVDRSGGQNFAADDIEFIFHVEYK